MTSNRELSSWFQPKIGNAMNDGEDTVALEVDDNKNEGKSLCDPDDDDGHDDRIDDFDLSPPSQGCIIPNIDSNDRKTVVQVKQPLKQASVKRLFTLAAVKAGQQSLCQTLAESVSLTQLECLPFHLQLEVANGQHDYDASVKPISSKAQPKALFRCSDHSKSQELGTSVHSTINKSRFETKKMIPKKNSICLKVL